MFIETCLFKACDTEIYAIIFINISTLTQTNSVLSLNKRMDTQQYDMVSHLKEYKLPVKLKWILPQLKSYETAYELKISKRILWIRPVNVQSTVLDKLPTRATYEKPTTIIHFLYLCIMPLYSTQTTYPTNRHELLNVWIRSWIVISSWGS